MQNIRLASIDTHDFSYVMRVFDTVGSVGSYDLAVVGDYLRNV